MGIAERREREKEKRRNDILDAAEKIFFSMGFTKATMDDVAEEAELSKGTLYLYFKNKEDLYLGISLRALALLKKIFEDEIEHYSYGIEKVKAIGEAYYRYSQRYSDYFNTIAHYEIAKLNEVDENPLALQCHQLGTQVLKVVADTIRTGIDDGTIRSDLDPMKTAYLLNGQSTGVIQLIARESEHIKHFESFNPEELRDDFINMMYHALKSNETDKDGTVLYGE